jgi:hypothetical protein
MGKLVDFEGYGLAEYPDDFTDAQIHDSWERNIKPILDAKKRVVLRENAAIANRNAEAANAENTIWQGTKSAVSDVGVGLMKGYVGIPEAIVGLANIPTKGYAGKWVEDAGIDFKGTKEYWDQKYSEGAKAAQAEVSQAVGFIPKGKALLDNPSALGQTIAESLPLMLGGAGLARLGLGAAKMIGPRAAAWAAGAAVPGSSVPLIAGAVGEGAIAAGSTAEGVRQQTEDRLLTWEQAGLSLASGALTGAIGIASGKMAKRLGIDDLDTFLVSGIPAGTAKRTLTERIARGLGGALTEGVLEEMPQSAQEQVANNLALKKPWNEGVAEAAATGLIVGGLMGGAMGGLMPGGQSAVPPPIPPTTTPPVQPPPLGSPQAPPALPGQVPKQPPSLPALSNQTLATPISSWVTAPDGPHVLGQSPNAFGVGQQVVQVSQSSGNFGKQGVVVSVAAPPAGGSPVVTVRFADGSQAKSDGKEFAFSEHFAQATAIKAGPLWTPPPPRPGTVPQPIPTNTNQQRRTPLDATEQLQAKINAARAVGDRALVRKLSIELDMMGTAAPVVKQPLPAQRTIKPSAPIASQDDEEGFVMPPLPPGVVAAPQAEPDEGFVMPALPPGVVAAPSSPKKPAAKAPIAVPKGAGQPITAKPSVSERLNALLKTGLVRMANAGQTTPDYEGLRARGGITMGIDTKTGELIVDEQNIKDISAAMAKGRVDIAETIMDRLESAAAHESIHRLIFDGKKYLPGFANLVNATLSGKDAQLQQFASIGLKHLLAIEHYRNLFVSTGVTLEGTIAEQTQRILKNPGALALTFNELLAGHANTRGAWSAKENSLYDTTRKELLKRAGIPAAMDKPPVTLLPKEHTKWLADNSTYKSNAPAPVQKKTAVIDADAIAENGLDQRGLYEQETPEFKQSIFNLFLKKAASIGKTDIRSLSRNYASNGLSGDNGGVSLSFYLASADGTGRTFGDNPAKGVAWEFRFGREVVPVTWGDLAEAGIATKNPDGTIRGSGFVASSKSETSKKTTNAPAPVPQQVGLPVKPEGTPPVGQAKPKAGTRNRLTSPAAGQAPAEAKPVDVGQPVEVKKPVKVIKLVATNPRIVEAQDVILSELGEKTDIANEVITPDGVRVTISAFGDTLRLRSIQTGDSNRGSGAASKTLDKIVRLADESQVPITLTAIPYGDLGLTKDQLILWYSKRGFELQADGETMVRQPKSKAEDRPFSPDDILIAHSTFTDEDFEVSYRGPLGDDKSVVWTGKTQMTIPTAWLRRKGEPLKQKAKPTDVAKPTPAATGATAQKMPWEMTRAEYQKTEPKSDGVRESLVADLGHSKVRVIKNPTPEDYQRFASEHNRQFPNDTSGDPKTRFTVDSNGNRYVWPAGDAAHSSLEGWLKERGITANQNTQFFSHKYHIFKALREGKPVPESVLADYKGEKWSDDALAKLKPPAAKPQPAAAAKPSGGVPYYRQLGVDDANDPSRKRMRAVPQNFKLAYINGWYEAKKAAQAKPEPAAEQPATKPKRVARGSTLLARFNAETERLGPDILSFMVDSGLKVQSKSVAKARGKEYWLRNRGDYDGALPLALPTHNIIYGGSRGPDLLAQDAFEANVIKEPTPDAFWEAVNNASRRRRAAIGNESQDEKFLNEEVAAYERWMKATEEGAIRVSADELQVGDLMDVEGEKVEVIAKDADTGEVTLKDGRKFETQKLQDGESIYVERLIQLEPADKDEANFRGILAQAADSSSKLRPQDVERVMSEAGWDSDAFKAWLLKQPLSDDTRKAVEQWGKEEQTLTAAGFNPGDRVTVSGGDKFHQDVTGVIAYILNDGRILEIVRDGDFTSIRINLEDYKKIEKAFSLAPAESVEEQKARLAAEALKGEADAAAKAKADSLTNAINKPLTGTVGDIAQDDMLDPQGGLFNNSNPLGNQPAPPAQPLAPLSPTEEDAARMDAIKKLLAAKLKQGPTYMGSLAPGGLDPEFFKLGTELGYLYIKSGVRKFSDFAARLINDLGEKAKPYLLSWYSNAKLTLTSIANELDSESKAQQYYQDTFGRPVQGGRVNTGAVTGSGVAGGRPGVRVARQELIPVPRQYVDAGAYSAASGFQLDEEQVRGVNLMVDRFKNVPAGAFLLADGTGFGKTAQLLAVADQYSKQGLGNKILIVTKNKIIADIRFAGDAKRMGIDPKSYTITTYSSLKNVESKGWDLVLFDEAHELKNSEAAKSIAGGRLQAKHKVFATATPMDTFTGAAYFLSEITGEDETQIATKLGYKLVERTDPYSKEVFMAAVLLPESTAKTVWQNIMAYRDAAVANGSMIRREYPFFGRVEEIEVDMDNIADAEQKRMIQYYDDLIDSAYSPTAKRNYAGQKTQALRRWSEQSKIKTAVQMALDHIATGGKAIIVAETDKAQKFPVEIRGSKWGKNKKGEEAWFAPGAITQMMDLLEKASVYDVSHIHDPKSNNISSEVDKFQRGPNRLALATPQSGGTGIDLDDSIGGQERLLISLSKNLAGDAFQQLVGRVSRKNTVTPAIVRLLTLRGSFADERSNDILNKKIKTLLAIQGGSELDTAAKPDDTDITQPGQQQPPYKPSPNKPASTAPPRLDWNPYTTQKGKQKFVAKVTPEFTAWYKSNGENRNSFGIFISDRDGRAWADANPNETALQSRTGSTTKDDTDYLAAVKAGDMETAQRMVDEAAKKAGYYTGPVYHGGPRLDPETGEARTVFLAKDKSWTSTRFPSDLGEWLSESKKVAEYFAGRQEDGAVFSFHVRLKNPKEFDSHDALEGAIQEAGGTYDLYKKLVADGHDSVELTDATDIPIRRTDYVVFDPSQIKSADPITRDAQGNVIPLSQRFNQNSDSILQSRTGSNPFYSRLNRAVEETPMQNATGFKWKGVINKWQKAKPTPTLGKSWLKGINRDEIDLVGVNDLEDGKTYSKQEVLDYLRANEVVVKDVTLGQKTGSKQFDFERDGYEWMPDEDGDGGNLTVNGRQVMRFSNETLAREAAAENFIEGADRDETHFSTYQLPGAVEGSYREVLLTVPEATEADIRRKIGEPYSASIGEGGYQVRTKSGAKFGVYSGSSAEQAIERARAVGPTDWALREFQEANWDDGHSQYSDIANPIVRLRYNERTTADGKRMLFLEEVQAPQKGEFEKMPALFQKNWREIAFKWALRHAAENGFDSVGWTTGAQQAARYDLSKQVQRIVVSSPRDGIYTAHVVYLGGATGTGVGGEMAADKLAMTVGKDVAAKAISKIAASKDPRYEAVEFSGDGLKIDSGGLIKLYDVDFRNVVNGIPAVKKSGQKVGMVEIQGTNPGVAEKGFTITQSRTGSTWTIRKITQDPAYVGDGSGGLVGDVVKSGFSSRQEAARWADENIKIPGVPIHSLSLTPAIRESVMGGQALFRRSDTATGLPASAVEDHIAQAYGSVPNGVIRVVERPDLNFDGQVILDAATGEFLRIEINASKLNSLDDIDKILTHEFSHIVFRDEGVQSIIGSLTDQERSQIEADMTRLGYTPDSLQEEGGARGIEQLANAWRGRNWFTQVVGRVLAWASEHGLKMTRLAAEMIAARAVAKVKAEVFMADEASIQQVSMGSELALQSRVVPDNAADLEIATAGQQVAAQVESIYASYEAGAQSLSQLALEKKEFRQARAELNKLTSLASARMTQLPNPAPGMTPDPMEGISVQSNQVVVGPEFSDKLTNLGVAHNAADAQAKQGAIFFERVADGVTTARERLKDLEAKRNHYISIKAPAADISQVENTINSNRAQIATLEQTEHDGVTAGQRADEIAAAESNKIDAEGKRDALKLAPVDDYFGGRMANLRELTEKAKASAALAKALMAGTTDPAELAKLTAEFERFDKLPETARDALVAGKMTDAQLSSVVIALQHSFVEFDLAKANMDDLLLAEQTRILKDIAQAEKDYKAALGANLDTEAVVDAALRSARGSAGLVGSVSGAARIDQLLLETAAISGMAQTLGQNIEQNRWLYDYLSGVRSTPGGILAFSKANADALGIGEDTLRKLVNAVQSSPALGSALVTLADHAAATRANNYALSLATTVPSISSLAAQAQASTVPSNAQALLNQANAAAATLASAVKPGVRAASKTAQLLSNSINQSLTQLAAVNNGANLFNQVANNPAFVAMRQNANGLNGLVINMIEPGPAKTTFLGFGTTSTVYHPELVINVDDDPANSHRTQGHIYQWSEAAKRYVADFDLAELAHRANPAANPTPGSLGFDRAKVIGLRTALEKQVNGSFLEVSLMDEAARTSIPKVVRKMLKRSWFRQHDFVARLVGGIYGTDLRATQGRWIRGHLNARRVAARFQDLPDLQASAMSSHGIKNISTYRSQIWNQMGGYGREFGSRLKVGFTLPVSGQTITKEDMVFFKRTIDFEEQLRRFVTEVDNTRGVREKIGGQTFVRGGGSVGDYGMPRHLGRNATAFIADIISSYLNTKGFTVSSDLSAASTEAVPAFWNKRVDMLKQHILDSTRIDRAMRQDPTMRKAEMAIANRWLSGAVDPVSSLQDLVQLLAAELATVPGINPMDYAVRHLNSELIQYHEHAVRIKAEREDPSTRNSGLSIALSSDNEFTKPAAKLELPHSLYDYGALTTGERISAQSRANHEMLVEYANALRRAIGDLKNRINRFDNNQISEAEAARSYGGGMEELRDTFEILSASLVDFEAGYKLGADPALSPSALASELARFPVAGVLALPTVSIRNLTGGQLVVYLMERAMGYTGARLAMYNAIKNAPKALAKASYASALNIARFLDKNLLKTNKKQLEDIVDIIAKVALSPVLLALKNPTTIIAGVKSDLDQVQKLGYDTKMGFVDAFRQAWKESGLYANREEEEAALRSPTATKIGRVTLTAAKGINAFLGAVGVENSDQVLNSVNLVQSQMMETRLGEVAMKFGARLESLGITSIDPTDRRSILLAAEWSPFLNAQASLDSLGQLRLFLEGSAASEGFQLENALLKFYQETKAGKPTHIFSAAQFEAVQRGLLAQMNTSLPTNRASVAAGNRMWRILLTLQGYPTDAFLKLINTAVGGTRNRTVAAQAASKLPLLIGIAMMAIIIGGMSDGASEYWKRKMQGIPSQNAGVLDRDFWQNKDKFMSGAGRFLAANMFYLGDVILGMQNQIQGNRGFDPASRVFPISLAQAFASSIQATFATYQGAGDMSDVATPMVDFFAKLTPGGMEIRNWFGDDRTLRRSKSVTSAEARAAGMELPKQGGQRSAGPTTIVKRNLESAVGAMEEARVSGDTEAYAKAEGQARAEMAKLENYYIKRETERGKSPEEAAKAAKAAVWRDYQEINPVSSALGGRRPTASEYQTITTGATGARAITQQAGISAWQQGANALFNKTGTVTRETASASSGGGTGGGSGGGYGATMTASSGVGRATSGRGRMVKARRSRLTAGRTTRSSLSRPKFRTRLRAPRNRKVSIKRVRLTA